MELLLIPIALLGYLLWDQRRRYDEQIQSLLDRIQAPEKVLAERSPEPSGEPLYVPFEDEEAYEEAHRNGEVT